MSDRGRGAYVRLAAAYAALFYLVGIAMPYWPVWLEGRGIEPWAIGIFMGIGPWVRVIANPLLGRLADRRGDASRIMVLLSLVLVASYGALFGVDGTFAIAACMFFGALGFSPIVPLLDGVAVRASAAGGPDYGRVRLVGSAAFIGASVLGGLVLEGADSERVLMLTTGGAVVLFATLVALRSGRVERAREPSHASVRDLLKQPGVALFLAAASALMVSHALLYAFGSIHWRALGHDESSVGLLWAVGVVAEIVLFFAARRLSDKVRPASWLIVAGVGGLVRWPMLALSESFGVLALAQVLHACTFACLHLGAMSWIRSRVEESMTSMASALYSGLATGLGFGLVMPWTGPLYARFEGDAFWVMVVPSAFGLLAAIILRVSRSDEGAEPAE